MESNSLKKLMSRVELELFRVLIGCVLLFSAIAASSIITDMIKHAHETIDCPDFPMIDGAGKPDVCK